MFLLKRIIYLLSWPTLLVIAGIIAFLYVVTYKQQVNSD